jgi:hypothetical protein
MSLEIANNTIHNNVDTVIIQRTNQQYRWQAEGKGDFDFTHADITTTADSDIYQDEDGNIKVRSYTGTVQV